MSGQISPIADADFDMALFIEEDLKAHSKDLEQQAAVTDAGLQHIASYDQAFAEKARHNRAKAIETLERQRLINVAKQNAEARRDAQRGGPRPGESPGDFVKRNPAFGVTIGMLDGALDGVIEVLSGMKDRQDARLKAIEDRIRELETQAGHNLRFTGDWSEKTEYLIGDVVHSAGSAWIALHRSAGVRPARDGFGSQAWGLFVSRGREGRPGRDGKDRQ